MAALKGMSSSYKKPNYCVTKPVLIIELSFYSILFSLGFHLFFFFPICDYLSVMTYMPQDFRGTLIRQQRERSERNKQAEIDFLVKAGGSIRDRYALLWKQQMERWIVLDFVTRFLSFPT